MRLSHEIDISHPFPLQERTMIFDEDSDLGSPKKIKLSSTEHEGCSFSDPPPSHFILLGRGERTNRHPGNKMFRRLVDQNRSLYHSGTKKRKGLIATSIVEAIYRHDQPGRFVRLDKKSELWFDVGMKQAIKKTSQALREIVSKRKNDDHYETGTDDEQNEIEDTSQNRNVIFSSHGGPFEITLPHPVSCDDEGDEEGEYEDDKDFKQVIENIEILSNKGQRSFEQLQLPDECLLSRLPLIYQTSDFTFPSISSLFEGNDSTVPHILNYSLI